MEEVSLGKALLERSAVNAKIQDILARIANNLVVEVKPSGEREQPAENPETLLQELQILESRHHKITNAITMANYETKVNVNGKQMRIIEIMETIEYLSKIIKRKKELIEAIENATIKRPRGRSRNDWSSSNDSNSKEVIVSILDIAKLRKEMESFCSSKNKLQVTLQEANWSSKITI